VNWTASTQPQATAGGQAGAAQYGQDQYGQGQYGAQQYAPPPKQRNTGLIVGIICAVVIVACGATIAIVVAGRGGGGNDDKGNPQPSNAASVKMVGLQNDRATGITYSRPQDWQDDTKDTDGNRVGAEMLYGQYTCPNGKTCYAGVVYSGKATAGETDLTAVVRDKLSDLVSLRIGFGNGVKVSSSNDNIDGHKAYTETQDFKPSDQQATPGTLRVAAIDLGNGTVAYIATSVNTQVHAPPAGTVDAIFRSIKTNT
jgi:hypothetical protein